MTKEKETKLCVYRMITLFHMNIWKDVCGCGCESHLAETSVTQLMAMVDSADLAG